MDTSVILGQIASKLLVAGIIALCVWPFKILKHKIEEFTAQLQSVYAELTTQRTNCLSTLQAQGEIQIKTLEKVSETLQAMHLDQRELLGKLD